jgi:hypothetical protein
MKMTAARKVSDLLASLDSIREWRETVEKEKKRFWFFGDNNAGHGQLDGMDAYTAYEGDLKLPREMAVKMLKWAEEETVLELSKLGVVP